MPHGFLLWCFLTLLVSDSPIVHSLLLYEKRAFCKISPFVFHGKSTGLKLVNEFE